ANQIPRFLTEAVLAALWVNLYVKALRADTNAAAQFHAYQKLARLGALVLFPSATLIAAQAPNLIALLLGPKWADMSPLFELLLLASAVTTIGTLGSAILYAQGRTAIQLRITVEAVLIRIVSVLLAPWFGLWVLWVGLPAASLYTLARNLIAACRAG